MPSKKRIILFYKIRKIHDCFYHYSLFRKNGHLFISIEEIKNGTTSFESTITDPEYSKKACLAFITNLADTLTSPQLLQELYEDNDLDDLS